jgi:hypothetical protein
MALHTNRGTSIDSETATASSVSWEDSESMFGLDVSPGALLFTYFVIEPWPELGPQNVLLERVGGRTAITLSMSLAIRTKVPAFDSKFVGIVAGWAADAFTQSVLAYGPELDTQVLESEKNGLLEDGEQILRAFVGDPRCLIACHVRRLRGY